MTHLFPCRDSRKEELTKIINLENEAIKSLTKNFKGVEDPNYKTGLSCLLNSRSYLGRYLHQLLKNGDKQKPIKRTSYSRRGL